MQKDKRGGGAESPLLQNMIKINYIFALATENGWDPIEVKDPTMVSFLKFMNGARARINVWFTTMTVGTYLEHPKQGKTQLFRRRVTEKELKLIFKNPRAHTGKGYR